MPHLFKVVPGNFFSVLAAPGKIAYWDCILRIFDITSSQLSFGVERDILVDDLEYYFESTMSADIEEENAGSMSPRDKANFMLRKLESCGWITVDVDHSYVQRVNFRDYAIDIIKTLQGITQGRKEEYQGYIYTIYNLCRAKDLAGIGLLEIVKNTDALITSLKSLNANIKNYIDDLTKHSSVAEILDALLNDYYSNVVDKAYHRLLTSDNVSKFRPAIVETLEKCARSRKFLDRAAPEIAQIREVSAEEAKGHPFLIGVVMDSASEEKEPNTAWYLMEKRELSDDLFFKGKKIKSISSFRSTNRGIRQFCPTIREARKMILNRFGRLDEKFFTLIPKALAFKPITDIKDFVYSYVLDEKEVNIDALRENVRSYQDLQRTLEDVKRRIAELEKIREKYDKVQYHIRLDRDQEYYIERARQDIYRGTVESTGQELSKNAALLEQLDRQRLDLERQIQDKSNLLETLRAELAGNADYQALRDLEKQQNALKLQIEKDEGETGALKKSVTKAQRQAEEILADMPEEEDISKYRDALKGIRSIENPADIRLMADGIISWKENEMQSLRQQQFSVQTKLDREKGELQLLSGQIRELEEKRLIYPANVLRLKGAIESQFRKSGRSADVHILCELLEITDPAWQNAVEGYLNTQRFYLLTDAADFDLALSVYERLRKKERMQGVGLINSGKLEKYDTAPEGSLAQVVGSRSRDAGRYINMVLGKVHRCESYQELKQYPVAITRQCMRYQNHVVSAINPKIYETPYIGAEAYKIQLAQKKEEAAALRAQIGQDQNELKAVLKRQKPLSTEADIRIRYEIRSLEDLRAHRAALQSCEKEIKNLRKHAGYIEKQIRIEELEKETGTLRGRQTDIVLKTGQEQGRRENLQQKISETQNLLQVQDAHISELARALGDDAQHVEGEYIRRREKSRDLNLFMQNFENNRKGNLTRKAQAQDEMAQLMRRYKADHDFGAADSLAGYPEFAAEYDRLKNSRLLEYEEKVTKARESAEEEFREQFLSRLQENIKAAQKEFRQLNQSLGRIHFGHENYEFLYGASRKQKKYYDMIMDDFNVLEGESIFSGMFEMNHREVIEELFEKLALDDEDSAATLQTYTDYRTYMDYDLKITSDDGSYMLYSKVSREKSGGETQTPFYITIAASFMQMYGSSIGGDSVGIVMMDEAFNNMDDERMSGVLSFMKHSNLQLIIAAPPDRIQYIGPAMDKIQLIMQDGSASYAEDFTVLQESDDL